jgi:hypothetical protein
VLFRSAQSALQTVFGLVSGSPNSGSTLQYLGGKNVGQAVPTAVTGQVAAAASATAALPLITAQVAGVAQATASFSLAPPGIGIGAALAMTANLTLNLPNPVLQASAIAKLIANIKVLGFSFPFPDSPGISLYVYSGTVGSLGSAITSALTGGLPGGGVNDSCAGVILATESQTTWTAMGTVLKVS